MSYILEALKKARAEREGNTAAPAPLPPVMLRAERERQATTRSGWPWLLLPVIGVSLAGVWLAMRPADVATPVVAQDPVPVAMAAATPRSPATPSGSSPAMVAAPPVKPAEAPPAPPLMTSPETTPSKRIDKPREKKRPVQEERQEAVVTKPAEPPVPQLHELPESLQREIPVIAVGGYIYSGNKADRSVLINNRLLREGDEAAPGLVIEQLQPNGMVLTYRGTRFRRGY